MNKATRARLMGMGAAGAFGRGVLADPSLTSSYPGLVTSNAGSIYPMLAAFVISAVPASGLIYEDRGATLDPYGGGVWVFPSTTNLAPNPFDFSVAGWATRGTMTVTTAVGTTSPTGSSVQKLYQTTNNYADKHVAISSTTSPVTFSIWYRWNQVNPPTVTWPAFTRQAFTPAAAAARLLNSATVVRFAYRFSGGTSNELGVTPAGSNAAGVGVNTAPGAVDGWGAMFTNGVHDLPIIDGTASAAKTLDAAHAAKIVASTGGLDFEVTFQCSVLNAWAEEDATVYLWSGTGPEGAASLRLVLVGSFGQRVPFLILQVRGVDVLDTQVTGILQYNASLLGEPLTVRSWYCPASGESGIRQSVNGALLNDCIGTTTGGALAPLTSFHLGTNLGSATAAFSGRFKPYRRPAPTIASVPPVQVEGIMIGDSNEAAFRMPFSLDAPGSYIYTQGAAGEWSTRPGIGLVAQSSDTVIDQRNVWIAATNRWRGLASVKWICVQIGVNNVIAGASSASVLADLQTLVNQLIADNPGAAIILSTILPFGNYVGWTAGKNVVWAAVNAGIVGGTITGVALVVDMASSAVFNTGADKIPAAVDAGDGLHLNISGRFAKANDPVVGWRQAVVSLGFLP